MTLLIRVEREREVIFTGKKLLYVLWTGEILVVIRDIPIRKKKPPRSRLRFSTIQLKIELWSVWNSKQYAVLLNCARVGYKVTNNTNLHTTWACLPLQSNPRKLVVHTQTKDCVGAADKSGQKYTVLHSSPEASKAKTNVRSLLQQKCLSLNCGGNRILPMSSNLTKERST